MFWGWGCRGPTKDPPAEPGAGSLARPREEHLKTTCGAETTLSRPLQITSEQSPSLGSAWCHVRPRKVLGGVGALTAQGPELLSRQNRGPGTTTARFQPDPQGHHPSPGPQPSGVGAPGQACQLEKPWCPPHMLHICHPERCQRTQPRGCWKDRHREQGTADPEQLGHPCPPSQGAQARSRAGAAKCRPGK